MSHHRRSLASPPLEPTHHKQPPTSTTKAHADPPYISVQNISNRFSKLYLDHQKSRAAKPVIPVIPISDSSTTAVSLTKSNSQRHPTIAEIGRRLNRVQTDPKPESKHEDNRELQFDDDDQLERQEIKREILSSSKINATAGKKNKEEGERGGEVVAGGPGGAAMGIARRRSFFCTQNEVNDFLACNGVKVVSVDMPAFMQIHAVDCARKTVDSLEKFTAKTLALTLKKEGGVLIGGEDPQIDEEKGNDCY